MVNLFTYQQLIYEFAVKHLQVNTVLTGDKKDLTGHRDIMYPLLNIEYLDKQVRGAEDIYRFEIIIADLSNDQNELIVINDSNMVADDLINYFENVDQFEDLEFFSNVSIKPFTDSFGDRVSGVTFAVNMTGFRRACIKTIPFPVVIVPNNAFPYAFPLQLA